MTTPLTEPVGTRCHPFDLTGKVALVTGANSGLGLGFANGVAKAGADVVIWGRREEANEAAAAQIGEHGGRVHARSVDVADEEQVRQGFADAVRVMGRVDCVVANAGVISVPASFAEMTSEEYHRVIAVNLHGAVYTLREAVRHMMERAGHGDGGGSLIVCGSLSVVAGVPKLEHYAAAKGGLMAVTRAMAVEYGRHGIRANMILPGRIASNLAAADDAASDRYSAIPIPRRGTPADLEGIAVYLMSDASAYHTGDMLTVDGGLSIALPGTH